MKHTPANVLSEHATGPNRAIGLFLARLWASLLRRRASGEATLPPYIAQMVASAEDIVRAYICNLAAVRLKSAGYAEAARVLRTTRMDRPDIAPCAHIELASLDEQTARLDDTITLFHQAEALSAHFARLVFCALCMIFTGEGTASRPPFALRAPSRDHRLTGSVFIARSPVNGGRRSSQNPIAMGRGPPGFSPPYPS